MPTSDPHTGEASGFKALAHVGDPTPAPLHSAVWAEWREVIHEHPPHWLDPAAGTCAGFAADQVPCTITLPPCTPRGILIDAPDLDNTQSDPSGLAARGLIVVQIGLRGCAPGHAPTRAWACDALGEGFERAEQAMQWNLIRAAGDLACAALASSKTWKLPVSIRGRSLGAALAVLAVAHLGHHLKPRHLVLELPALADWRWRWAQAAKGHPPPRGIGGWLLEHAGRFPARRAELFNALRLIDPVVSATRITCPTLCKLALHDEVVPPPTAAAVYNALGCNTGEKWRFVVPAGHAEAGIANARRHALFERCASDFLDPGTLPHDAMNTWWEVLSGGGDHHIDENQQSLFADQPTPDATDTLLIDAYQQAGRTLDDLPYTPQFDALFDTVHPRAGLSARDTFHRLHTLRKAGRLPRLGRAPGSPPRIDPQHEQLLIDLVEASIGKLSLRDRLPYTPRFDQIVQMFNTRAGLALEPHEIWRIIAKLAK